MRKRETERAERASFSFLLVPLTSHPPPTHKKLGAEIARSVLASPIWKRANKVGVYLAAPRLREVDTELLVRAALAGGGGGGGEDGGDGGAGSNGCGTSPSEGKDREQKKRLFVPIVGDGPQEMCLVHLGEYFVPS